MESRPMITLNKRQHIWREGLTVRGLLDENSFTYKHIVVVINDKPVPESVWAETVIKEGDNIDAIHLMAGG